MQVTAIYSIYFHSYPEPLVSTFCEHWTYLHAWPWMAKVRVVVHEEAPGPKVWSLKMGTWKTLSFQCPKMSQSLRNFCTSLGANKVCWVILSKIFGSLLHHQELVCAVFWNAASLFDPSCLNVCTFILVTVTAFSMTRLCRKTSTSKFSHNFR